MTQEAQYIKIDKDGNKFYYKNKAMTTGHRLDGPAFESADGSKEWWVDGKQHRLDGPAFEGADGSKIWFVDGNLHRLDGPAVDYASGYKEWWVKDKRHRLDGPAIENADGSKAWWVDDRRLSEEAFDALTKPLEPMDMNDTPESDEHDQDYQTSGCNQISGATLDFCRKLERERDEAREQRDGCQLELQIVVERLKGQRHPDDNGIRAKGEIDIKSITEQLDNCQLELQIVTERLKGQRHPDDNGMKYEGEIDIKAITEQRDRLAEACRLLMAIVGPLEEKTWATDDQIDRAYNEGEQALAANQSKP